MDPTAIRKLLTEARACMRACGWQLATAGDPQSDGVLEAACSDVEERMGEYLSAPDPRDATIAALRAEVKRLRDALFEMIRTLDEYGRIERGAGGMTIEAQIRHTVINRIPAWAVEEARAALDDAP